MHKCWSICPSLNLLTIALKLDGLCWQISSLHTLYRSHRKCTFRHTHDFILLYDTLKTFTDLHTDGCCQLPLRYRVCRSCSSWLAARTSCWTRCGGLCMARWWRSAVHTAPTSSKEVQPGRWSASTVSGRPSFLTVQVHVMFRILSEGGSDFE